jgi:hypothetical protein
MTHADHWPLRVSGASAERPCVYQQRYEPVQTLPEGEACEQGNSSRLFVFSI